jgi:hypothetical protein
VSGPPRCGKSRLVQASLPEESLFLDCLLFSTTRQLYAAIARGLSCASVPSTPHALVAMLQAHPLAASLVMAFDQADVLAGLDPVLVPVLLRLAELTGQPIVTVMISKMPWEFFVPQLAAHYVPTPALLYLPRLDKDAAIARLAATLRPSGLSAPQQALWPPWCKLVVDLFWRSTTRLDRLGAIIQRHFGDYCTSSKDGRKGVFRMFTFQKYHPSAATRLSSLLVMECRWFRHISTEIESQIVWMLAFNSAKFAGRRGRAWSRCLM